LEEQFFFFINSVRGLPLPQIPDEDIAPIRNGYAALQTLRAPEYATGNRCK
jgi:hypothetical protein